MILFGLTVSQNITELFRDFTLEYKTRPNFFTYSYSISRSLPVAYAVNSPEILTGNKMDLVKKKFIQKNYWQKIVNSAWRQVIFLSIPSKSYDRYVVELNYLDSQKDQGSNKRLISNFSKSLLEGSVTSLISAKLISPLAVSSVQYVWRKSFNLKQEKILSFFQSDPRKDYFKSAKKYFVSNAFADHFPLFVVSNYLGQMIISEPPTELEKSRDMFDYIVPRPQSKRLHQAWFFTSFEDAQEYMASIADYYDLKKDHLKIFICSFSNFYDIVNKFGNKVYFRLIPDLKEVSDLVRKYRTYRNISFHKRQNYTSTSFQGQPLYVLKTKQRYGDFYSNIGLNSLGNHHLLFTNYVTACNVLKKITDKSFALKKLHKHDFLVYNLESFIQDELSKDNPTSSFLLVPSENTYWFTKKYFLQKKANMINYNISKRLLSIHLWSKRVLWSLTSKQPG